uniref:Putative baseplate protein n=1 Tax=viral metagenome TaxID=1070528 RepID=A0A6M3IXP2_9ZZZZ
MPLTTYTIDQLRTLVLARKGVEEPTLSTDDNGDAWLDANAVAHLAAMLQMDAQDVYNALFPHLATGGDLDEHARVWLDSQRLVATVWIGRVELTRTTSAAVTVPNGTQMLSSDGLIYETTASASSWDSSNRCVVTAQSISTGAACNKADATALTVQSPPVGCSAVATVNATTTAAIDDETHAHLRSRILLATQYRPGAGSPADYVSWALEACPRVFSAYVYPRWNDGAGQTKGTVWLRPLGEDNAHIFTADDINTIAAYIETRRPVGATVTVLAPDRTTQTVALAVTPQTGYGPDWTITGASMTINAVGTTGDRLAVDYAGGTIAGLAVGDRIVCAVGTVEGGYEQRIIRSAVMGAAAGTITVSPPFSAVPTGASVVRAGGPLWQPVFDAVLAVFYGLGTSSSNDADKPRFPTEADGCPSTLYLSDIYHAGESIEGVLAVNVSNPVADVTNVRAPMALPAVLIPSSVAVSWA